MPVDDAIRQTTDASDIAVGSEVYREIVRRLTGLGLDLAFFVFDFKTSGFARSVDGVLKHDADFDETGIDPHRGNWGDEWAQTRAVRDVLNATLQQHGHDDYVSEHTFVFVRTLEELAFQVIGRESKSRVARWIQGEVPGATVSHVFWNGLQYDVILKTKADCKRVRHAVESKAAKALSDILAAADTGRHCRSYAAKIGFGQSGMNLFHLMREDLGGSWT